ncbi:amino acid permease [bacterium]|nr:amino acid permease [bacterium]
MANIFRVKPIDAIIKDSASQDGDQGLKRVLGLPSLMALGVGTILGTGVFVLTGSAAAEYAGPSLIISFIIAAIACAFSALCYSEFSASIPVAGSAYTYGYATLGEVVAFVIALDCLMEFALGASAVAVGWSGYCYSFMQDLFGPISPRFMDIPGADYVLWNGRWQLVNAVSSAVESAGADMAALPHTICSGNLLSLGLIVVLALMLVRGIELSSVINSIIVVLKLSIVLVFVGIVGSFVLGHWDMAMQNWTPFIPANTGEFGKFGWSGIARGAAVLFFAYVGFDCVATAAQEAKNPTRDVPLATMGSLLICTVAYIVVCLLITGTINYTQLNVSDPAARAIDATGVTWGIFFIKGGLTVGLISGTLALLMSVSRIVFSMANDGLLPECLCKVHSKFRSPWVATLVPAVPIALLTAFYPIDELGELVSLGALMAFTIVCASILVLRSKYPNRERLFSTPWVPFIPILGSLTSAGLMLSLSGQAWIRFGVFFVVGMVFYFAYSVKHSKLNNEE